MSHKLQQNEGSQLSSTSQQNVAPLVVDEEEDAIFDDQGDVSDGDSGDELQGAPGAQAVLDASSSGWFNASCKLPSSSAPPGSTAYESPSLHFAHMQGGCL